MNYRFIVDVGDINTGSYQMLRHLAGIHLTRPDETANAIESWFSQGEDYDLNKWKKKHPFMPSTELDVRIEQFIRNQQLWIKSGMIAHTPALFINDKKYPYEFSLDDLKFQIRILLESTEKKIEVTKKVENLF